HVLARAARLQAQRVAAEIGLFVAVMGRDVELGAQAPQRVLRVPGRGVGVGKGVGHAKRPFGSPSHSSAVPWYRRALAASSRPMPSITAPGSCSPSGNG